MIRNIIKRLVSAYQAKKLAKHRLENNRKQLKLIYEGLEQRG